jgi:hypothetical protein
MVAERAAFAGEPAPPHPQLSMGDSGTAVSELQEKLHRAIDEPKVEVTSHFDGATDADVKRFQVQSGLRPDGIVGVDTWGALDSVFGGAKLSGDDMARLTALRDDAEASFDGGDFAAALPKYMKIYGDPAGAHKAMRRGLAYDIAACHHHLGQFAEAISFYQEVMGLPGVGAEVAGSAAENLRRARLQEPFQSQEEMAAERAAYAPS